MEPSRIDLLPKCLPTSKGVNEHDSAKPSDRRSDRIQQSRTRYQERANHQYRGKITGDGNSRVNLDMAALAAPPPPMPELNTRVPEAQKCDEVIRACDELFYAVNNWVDFYRMVFGVKGIVEQMYPSVEEQSQFAHTPAYARLQAQLSGLRERDTGKAEEVEPQRMITIRVPKSIHDRLVSEADSMEVSVNRLCISKLVHMVEPQAVPKEKGRRRGRRPGPQKQTRGPKKAVESAPTNSAVEMEAPGKEETNE